MLAAAVSTGLLPLATTAADAASFVLVILLRVVLGLADAFVNPSVNRFIVSWFPKEKRTLALTVVTCGRQLAVLVVFPIAGAFCMMNMWEVLFYCASIITFAWCSIWALFIIFQLQICYKKPNMETAEKIIDSTVFPRIPFLNLIASNIIAFYQNNHLSKIYFKTVFYSVQIFRFLA